MLGTTHPVTHAPTRQRVLGAGSIRTALLNVSFTTRRSGTDVAVCIRIRIAMLRRRVRPGPGRVRLTGGVRGTLKRTMMRGPAFALVRRIVAHGRLLRINRMIVLHRD